MNRRRQHLRWAWTEVSSGGYTPRPGGSHMKWRSGRASWRRGIMKAQGDVDEKSMSVLQREARFQEK